VRLAQLLSFLPGPSLCFFCCPATLLIHVVLVRHLSSPSCCPKSRCQPIPGWGGIGAQDGCDAEGRGRGAYLLLLEKSRRKNRNTLSASRKIEAAISGAESMSVERRSRWKSDMVRPAKTTSPMIE
jgi:hypothetical protein